MRVVSHPGCDLQVAPQLILVLKETAEELFPKHNVAIATLLEEGERASLDIILKRRE